MASLLERMNLPTTSSAGPVRQKNNIRSALPYNRNSRPPKGDIDSQWTHDLYDAGSLADRLSDKTPAPKVNLTTITQKAIREATSAAAAAGISIKGAGSTQGNVVEVSGLVAGTTPEDVAAIFKRCGDVASSKLVSAGDNVRVRLTFKTAAAAMSAVQKFNNQPADGKILSVRIVGATSAGTTLSGRIGSDGLGLVREEGSVDVLMESAENSSKMRSDALCDDPRAQVLVAPPGTDPVEYVQGPGRGNAARRGRGRGGRPRRGGRGGQASGMKMDTD